MNLAITTDHRGKRLKDLLVGGLAQSEKIKNNFKITDIGGGERGDDDYPLQALKLLQSLDLTRGDLGIVICGTGIGMAIAANKWQGVRAALLNKYDDYAYERKEHQSNVLIIEGDAWAEDDEAKVIAELLPQVENWLSAAPAFRGRHLRRVNQIKFIEHLAREDTFSPPGFPVIAPAPLDNDTEKIAKALEMFKFAPPVSVDLLDNSLIKGNETISVDQALELLRDYDGLAAVHSMNADVETEVAKLAELDNLLYVYMQVEIGLDRCHKLLDNEWPFSLCISIDAETEISAEINELAKRCNAVQIMTVEAGAQGKPFLPETLTKITKLRESGFDGEIHLDGGLNENTIPVCRPYKPDIYYIGSALLSADNPLDKYQELSKTIA